MQPVIVASRFQAHEIALLVISVILGINYLLVTIPTPQSLQALLTDKGLGWVATAWAMGLLLSGLAGLGAILWRRDVDIALQIERAAMVMSTGSLFLILGSVLTFNGLNGAFGSAFILAWMIANVARTFQIRKELKSLLAIVEAGEVDER